MIKRKVKIHQRTTVYLLDVDHRLADTIPIKNAIRAPE